MSPSHNSPAGGAWPPTSRLHCPFPSLRPATLPTPISTTSPAAAPAAPVQRKLGGHHEAGGGHNGANQVVEHGLSRVGRCVGGSGQLPSEKWQGGWLGGQAGKVGTPYRTATGGCPSPTEPPPCATRASAACPAAPTATPAATRKGPTCVLPPAAGTSAALTHLTQLPLSTSATLAAMPIRGYTVCSSSSGGWCEMEARLDCASGGSLTAMCGTRWRGG